MPIYLNVFNSYITFVYSHNNKFSTITHAPLKIRIKLKREPTLFSNFTNHTPVNTYCYQCLYMEENSGDTKVAPTHIFNGDKDFLGPCNHAIGTNQTK